MKPQTNTTENDEVKKMEEIPNDYGEWTENELQFINSVKEIYHMAFLKYPKNEKLLMRYNDFLLGINDQLNQRALLNEALQLNITEENSKKYTSLVWKLFREFEEKCGSVESQLELEDRISEIECEINADIKNERNTLFSFIWVKDLFSYKDLKPYRHEDDMDYGSMQMYYDRCNNDQKKNLADNESKNEMLTQFINILPMNYQGRRVNVNRLMNVIENLSSNLI